MAAFRYITVFLFCAAAYGSIPAEEPSDFPFLARPVKDLIHVRLDSSIQSALIATLSRGDTVRVIEEKYEWYRVILPARISGYISQQYVDIQDSPEGKVTARGVNIRVNPRSDSPVIGSVDKGEPVLIQGKEGAWYRVSAYPYGKGWVYRNLLEQVPPEECPAQKPEEERPGMSLRRHEIKIMERDHELAVTDSYPQGFGYLKTEAPSFSGVSLRVFQNECEVEGTLKRNEHSQWCAVPYTVVSDEGTVFLNSTAVAEPLLNKKIQVTGNYVIGTRCVYVEAQAIKEQ